MAYSVSSAKSDLSGIVHSTSLSRVTNVNGLFNRAARELLAKIDPKETLRTAELTLYQSVYDYAPPTDLKGDKIVDIRPQVNRTEADNFSKVYNEPFDLKKTGQTFTVEWDDAAKVLRISRSLSGSSVLNDMESLTANGTWTAAEGATGLAVDDIFFTQGSGSLNFDIGAAGGYIENSSMRQLDMTDGDEIDAFFADVYIPDATLITNIIARWGNDASNFWSRTATAAHFGAFKNGWNIVRFDWNGATETGSVNPATIDYARITVTSTAADTDIRADNLRFIRPHIHEALYYSAYLFRSSATVWLETISNDENELNLSTDSYNLFLYEAGRLAAQQLMTSDPAAARDFEFFTKVLNDGYIKYKADYPSENILVRGTYYAF